MEKCEKVWQKPQPSARREVRRKDYSKTVAGETIEMRACSACAGDYEDPDRTAWTPDGEEDEERDSAPCVTAEEFPAGK